jgi:hypothetical protein
MVQVLIGLMGLCLNGFAQTTSHEMVTSANIIKMVERLKFENAQYIKSQKLDDEFRAKGQPEVTKNYRVTVLCNVMDKNYQLPFIVSMKGPKGNAKIDFIELDVEVISRDVRKVLADLRKEDIDSKYLDRAVLEKLRPELETVLQSDR